MSLFDPLYQIEERQPPSLAEISKSLGEFDGSGSGLMTARQTYAACQGITNLDFTDQELQEYVKEGLDVAGDGSGRIKLAEFASYLAFEAKKKYKKTQKKATATTQPTNEDAYINPFADFASEPAAKKPATKIMITPDPTQKGKENTEAPVDMSASYSPTESDPTNLPQWFGHSVNTIQTHPNEPTADDPFAFFDDDMKSNPQKPHHVSVATQDILFADDDTTTSNGNSSSSAVVPQNLNVGTPKARTVKKTQSKSSRHGASKSTTLGLIAPPRSKRDPKPKKKKKGGKHGATLSGSFMNTFADIDSSFNAKTKAKYALKLKKVQSEQVLESPNKLQTRATDQKPSTPTPNASNGDANPPVVKKKRPKIDAIVVMKRGAAMLKYGRRGFPHFRRFQISHDLTKLLWYSRKKGLSETHVSIPDMKDILDGQQTEVFKQCTQKTLEKASFSIIYGPKLKSLDVVAKSSEEAALWIKGLKGLIKANQQGKLHKVVQILVDVDFKDISKTKYRQCTDDERRKYESQHKNRPELVHTITTTLQQSRKIFQSLVKITASNNVQNSNEYENVQTLTSEVEERLEEIEFGLQNKTADLTDLKRDVWVLKVDVTVLEEKAKVLSRIKTAIPI